MDDAAGGRRAGGPQDGHPDAASRGGSAATRTGARDGERAGALPGRPPGTGIGWSASGESSRWQRMPWSAGDGGRPFAAGRDRGATDAPTCAPGRSQSKGGRRSGPPDSLAWSALYARPEAAQGDNAISSDPNGPIQLLYLVDPPSEVESLRILACPSRHGVPQPFIESESDERLGHARRDGRRRIGSDDEAVDSIADRVADSRSVDGDRWKAGGQRLRQDEALRLRARSKGEHVGNAKMSQRIGPPACAGEEDSAGKRGLGRPHAHLDLVRPTTDDDETKARCPLRRQGERVEHGAGALLVGQPAERRDD